MSAHFDARTTNTSPISPTAPNGSASAPVVLNPRVNAIVALQDRANLLLQAREHDVQLARGELMGPLHGFPFAVKDLVPVRGIRMTMGSPILKDFVPPADSVMVERLRKAGAIFIGKTNTPEFGLGSHTYNPV